MAAAIVDRCAQLEQISPEAVRRVLARRHIAYRRAKEWLTSPDPAYERKKRRRDRLLAWARSAPDGAAIWLDESWFVRWLYCFWAWATQNALPRVAKRWNEAGESVRSQATGHRRCHHGHRHRWDIGYPGGFLPIPLLQSIFPYGWPAIATGAVARILLNAIFLIFTPPKVRSFEEAAEEEAEFQVS